MTNDPFPERFASLPPYAFPRLRALLDHLQPGGDVIHMTIGEPKHAFPDWVKDVLAANVDGFNSYPPNDGTPELREAIAAWVHRRYGVEIDAASQILPLNGTREGLYNVGMALCPEQKNGQRPTVLMPNPFYQVYMISSISAGAEPVFVPATAETGHLPDFAGLPSDILDRAAMLYICSPANPQGAVASESYWRDLITLAEKHDIRILADECYSEIYRETPPPGALEIATKMGADPERVIIFHSLSKRSNLPGLRSGFAVGGPESLKHMKQLRNYSGAPLPLPIQRVSEKVWADEDHVIENRRLYREKFEIADEILGNTPGYMSPEAGFFLWLRVPNGEEAAVKLWTETGVRVLPGRYLSKPDANGVSPGDEYIRVALVASAEEVRRGLTAIKACLYEQ